MEVVCEDGVYHARIHKSSGVIEYNITSQPADSADGLTRTISFDTNELGPFTITYTYATGKYTCNQAYMPFAYNGWN